MNLTDRKVIPDEVRQILLFVVFALLSWQMFRHIQDALTAPYWESLGGRIFVLSRVWIFPVVLILAGVNWMLEGRKWSLLHSPMGVGEGVRKVLVGLVLSLVSPFSVGDYVGRYMATKSEGWKSSAHKTLLCSLAQNFWNFFGGVLMFEILNGRMVFPFVPEVWVMGVWVFVGLALALFFNMERALSYFGYRGIRVGHVEKMQVLLTAGLRYITYALQYILILMALGSQLDCASLVLGVTMIYWVQSGLPLPPMLGALARFEIAILIFSYEGEHELFVLVAALILWSINVILPALAGYVYLIGLKKETR